VARRAGVRRHHGGVARWEGGGSATWRQWSTSAVPRIPPNRRWGRASSATGRCARPAASRSVRRPTACGARCSPRAWAADGP